MDRRIKTAGQYQGIYRIKRMLPKDMKDLTEVKIEFFKQMIKQGKSIRIKVLGGSMWPFLKMAKWL